MQGKYEESPILNLYGNMYRELESYIMQFNYSDINIDRGYYRKLDEILKLILLNNGCKISQEKEQEQYFCDIIPNEYQICFVTGMIGNDANEYYDFLIFNGVKVLVIFIEYFNDIIVGEVDEDDELYNLKTAMGNSVYYDAIKRIVEVFYLTSEPMPRGLLTTTMATTQRWNQAIIAINILNEFKPVDENDVSDISMSDIKKILNGKINLQLYGIRTI